MQQPIHNTPHKRKDLTGQRFGRLIVLSYVGYRLSPGGQKRAVWECVCDCGKVFNAQGGNIVGGHTSSCGCLKRDSTMMRNSKRRMVSLEEIEYREQYKIYSVHKQTGAKHGHGHLEYSFWLQLVQRPCAYCGDAPKAGRAVLKRIKGVLMKATTAWLCHGVDRVNSEKGYVVDNVVPCCTSCNRMKSDLDRDFFLSQVCKIARNHTI
jgi:hypothetical protein